ncbi:LPXTG cell wall anchor domain-containing protein [Corynebacterium spheniscorum]|uniref:LPXTG cell wall anchor domain-containing protein n=1 Tax=Corynebacterium spheniscorum TaxID=185761 RepID=UPI0015A67316
MTPPSDPPATTTPPRPTGPLALTGANVGWLAGLGLLALVAGGFLVLRRTR